MISGEHDRRCPNYPQYKPFYYCSICGEGIYAGDEYIENYNGERIHFECAYGTRWLLNWLGEDVKIMENVDEH